ncbi:MAG TPA: glucosidase [Thermoanaerobaculia bacterium]|jgi:hypothetical protein|nr:glucosidase [Thermoanaerobaculia bacterium]
MSPIDNPERQRLAEADRGSQPWRRWGPYLSERQWGTVREDYSADGDAWSYLPHDHARSRAYRWGEDGIAGLCDRRQRLCFSVAFWNGRDPILKERLFGLTGHEGNHGEDVKELYWYLDATPTSAYLKMLYKYPQAEFPYAWLVEENGRRGKGDPEFELIDTGVFDQDRYFDCFVEVAKAGPEDLAIRIEIWNRGPEAASVVVLPQLVCRNTWNWGPNPDGRPSLRALPSQGGRSRVRAEIPEADKETLAMVLDCAGAPPLLFCENETNAVRLFGAPADGPPRSFKDGIHEAIVHGRADAVNLERGTKVAARYDLVIPAGGSETIQLRLSRVPAEGEEDASPWPDFDELFALRRREADEFYATLPGASNDPEARRVQRLAYAGLLWSKQFYHFDVPRWLRGDPGQPPPPPERRKGRDHEWFHLNNADVISMPDTWEYPWYAAWDLAFHCVPLATLDPAFAKGQLILLTREWYMHPNGQLPAYEWAFGDVNPPVHAWAALRVYEIDRDLTGKRDLDFLERVFHKLMLNFTWWVNRKDTEGRNVFQGGFLGLDNIGLFDRSKELPTGGTIDQADGTGWMAMYSLNLMRIALELAIEDPVYEDIATKFFEHFLYVAGALSRLGSDPIADPESDEIDLPGFDFWDEQDQFYYDVLHLPGGRVERLRVRSMVGLIPMFAVEVLDTELLAKVPHFAARMRWFLDYRPDLARLVSHFQEPGKGERRLLALLRRHRLGRVLSRVLDEAEFLSPYGVRALSRYHRDHPYEIDLDGKKFSISYQPGESESGLFGGNSNWRGPIWFPVNFMIIEALRRFEHYYGDAFEVELPTGSGNLVSLGEVADELARRLGRLFLPDEQGRRPVAGDHEKLQRDPHFRDHVLFYEYFHGDTGRGVGASHQTGWTALVAELLTTVAAV